MNFKVGEKVVCVDDSPPKQLATKHLVLKLVLNEIYTIRNFVQTIQGIGIHLEEIVNPIVQYREGMLEPVYDNRRFRKLDYAFAENLLAEIKEQVLTETL